MKKILRRILICLLVLVVAGVGAGIYYFTYDPDKAAENDKIIVNVTQCLAGSVNMNIYATGKSLKNEGVCNGYDSTSESALGKLFYLMGESEDNALVKSRLEDVLRGEISK